MKVCKGDEKEEKKEGLECAEMWLVQVEKRVAQRAKREEKKKVKERDNDGTNVVWSTPVIQSPVQVPTAPIPSSDPCPALLALPPSYERGQTAAAAMGSTGPRNIHTYSTPHRGTSSPFLYPDLTNMPKAQQHVYFQVANRTRQRRKDSTGDHDTSEINCDLLVPPTELPNP